MTFIQVGALEILEVCMNNLCFLGKIQPEHIFDVQ